MKTIFVRPPSRPQAFTSTAEAPMYGILYKLAGHTAKYAPQVEALLSATPSRLTLHAATLLL